MKWARKSNINEWAEKQRDCGESDGVHLEIVPFGPGGWRNWLAFPSLNTWSTMVGRTLCVV